MNQGVGIRIYFLEELDDSRRALGRRFQQIQWIVFLVEQSADTGKFGYLSEDV